MFNNIKTINSLQKMTEQRLNKIINEDIKINLQILKTNVILENFEKQKIKLFLFEWTKLLCNYHLELFVGITFPSNCDNQCQTLQFFYLTSDKKPFGDLSDFSLKFQTFDPNSNESPTEYFIENVILYQTLKYYEEPIYIQSIIEEYYLSISFINVNTFQIPISLSKQNKTLFIMKKNLDFPDASSVYASFISLIPPDLYLRHENGQIIISKYDQSILFRQDSTFKLIFDQKKDLIAFQLINVPDYVYIAVDGQNNSNLTLLDSKEQVTIDKFHKKFIFKIISAT